jgi:hypothetical protein
MNDILMALLPYLVSIVVLLQVWLVKRSFVLGSSQEKLEKEIPHLAESVDRLDLEIVNLSKWQVKVDTMLSVDGPGSIVELLKDYKSESQLLRKEMTELRVEIRASFEHQQVTCQAHKERMELIEKYLRKNNSPESDNE